jgi:hypothetical protein
MAPSELAVLASLSFAFDASRENRQEARVRAPVESIGVAAEVRARDGKRADSDVLMRFAPTGANRTVARPGQRGR